MIKWINLNQIDCDDPIDGNKYLIRPDDYDPITAEAQFDETGISWFSQDFETLEYDVYVDSAVWEYADIGLNC